MLLKALVFAYLVSLVASQSIGDCSSTSFNFYNGYPYNGDPNKEEQLWDWYGDNFNDGTSDTFDSFFYTTLLLGEVSYSLSDYYSSPVDYFCDIGTTDETSNQTAIYTYNITDTTQYQRSFFAPRTSSWIRVVDTIINNGAQEITANIRYFGNLGSDSSTSYTLVTKDYWVSYEQSGSDPPFGVNAGGPGAIVPPLVSTLTDGSDQYSWDYKEIVIPAGEKRSIFIVMGQYIYNVDIAMNETTRLATEPNEIFAGLESVKDVVNWGFCNVDIKIVTGQDIYCSPSASATFSFSKNVPLTFNGADITLTSLEYTASVVNGANTFGYVSGLPGCSAMTVPFNFKVPSAELVVSVDTKGKLPTVTATGGFGGYQYQLDFNGNLENAFGTEHTVTVTDQEGCTANAKVTLPSLNSIMPPTGKVSGGSKLLASLTLFVALIALF